MTLLTWICIAINSLTALFILSMFFNPGQDAAGKGMLGLPFLLLLAFAGLGWLLMKRNYPVAALLVNIIPAVISLCIVYLTVRK